MSQCQFCGGPLSAGFVEIRPPRFNPLAAAGPSTLVFESTLTDFAILVPAQRKLAQLCARCGSVEVADQVWLQ